MGVPDMLRRVQGLHALAHAPATPVDEKPDRIEQKLDAIMTELRDLRAERHEPEPRIKLYTSDDLAELVRRKS